jgi:hypothetical protein
MSLYKAHRGMLYTSSLRILKTDKYLNSEAKEMPTNKIKAAACFHAKTDNFQFNVATILSFVCAKTNKIVVQGTGKMRKAYLQQALAGQKG